MNPNDGGQSSSDLQRKAAAQIARKKVLAAYASTAQKSNHPNTNSDHLKDNANAPKINSESWRKYHTAWQDYYQKYYSDYYAKAARTYIEKERLKDSREKALEDEILQRSAGKIAENTPVNDPEDIKSQIRQKIRKKATDSAKKTRRYRKLIPVFVGAFAVLLILFLQYNRLIFAPIMAYMSPGEAPATEIEAIDATITQSVSPEPRLIIPKLNIDVPVHFGISLSEVMGAMNNGVAHYRIAGASAFPGEMGNMVITGHSAGDIYSSNPYKYIFSGLERLEDGDLIYVNYESKRYIYSVTKKEVVEPTNTAALVVTTNKPLITLVTCTPLGTSRYRLLVTGEQISPNLDGTTPEKNNTPVDPKKDDSMPSNEPSFFEGIWNWLTGN